MKTSELTGALLDHYVALALGADPKADLHANYDKTGFMLQTREGKFLVVSPGGVALKWQPSKSWAQCGPIMGSRKISIRHMPYSVYSDLQDNASVIVASLECRLEIHPFGEPVIGAGWYAGDTEPQAAMRAFVASVYGDDIPDDIPS